MGGKQSVFMALVFVWALSGNQAQAGFWEGFADGFNKSFHFGRGSADSLDQSTVGLGFYKVRAKRKGGDIYELDTGAYLKTRNCYEYTFGDDAILEITSSSGYNIGTLTFVDSGSVCAVQAYMR